MGSIGYDLPTAILCLVMASALSALHALSSPSHKKWFTLPWYVRVGFLVSAIGMVYRGAELFTLAKPSTSILALGHIDPVGFALTCSMTFTFCALSLHALLSSLSPTVRLGVENIERVSRLGPKGQAVAKLKLQNADLVVEPMGEFPPQL